ncbi:MAG: S1C family serine protease, partial [Acidimicrobiales bacterium]
MRAIPPFTRFLGRPYVGLMINLDTGVNPYVKGVLVETTNEHSDTIERSALVSPARHAASHQMRMLKSLTAAVVIVGVGVGGFLIGHGVAKTRVASASPRFSYNGGFPGNSANFPGFNGFPSITLPTTPYLPTTTPPNPAANKIAARVDPGLVDINTGLSYQQASAAGTGMILTKNGLVLTNNHVIAGATSISVRDVATNKVYEAKVLGYDSTNDVALLKLKHASNLTTVKLGNSQDVNVSEKVIGIGNAGGSGGTPSIAP